MNWNFFSINMPYVIEKVDKLNGKWVVLNRDYSPLGFLCQRLKWDLFPKEYLRLEEISQKKIDQLEKAGAKICRNKKREVCQIYLYYHTGFSPVDKHTGALDESGWNAYCKLLLILATIIPD